ncbi:hypothetical protein, partial [Lacticaseibacillus paracasei]
TDAWRNSLDHYQEFVIIVALDLKIEVDFLFPPAKNRLWSHGFSRKLIALSLQLNPDFLALNY